MRGALLGLVLVVFCCAPAEAEQPAQHHGPDTRPCVAHREWRNLVLGLNRRPLPTAQAVEARWEVVGLGWDAEAKTIGGDYSFTSRAYPRCGLPPDQAWYGFTTNRRGEVTTLTQWCAHRHCYSRQTAS